MKTIAAALLCFAAVISVTGELAKDEVGSAIDAKGVRHVARRPTGMPPWIVDTIFRPTPSYPYVDRANRIEGRVIVRVEIDLKTGVVTNATLVQSSGFPKLDEAAVGGLRRWRWKPGRWKEVETPVIFKMR
jgi:TonB family protein